MMPKYDLFNLTLCFDVCSYGNILRIMTIPFEKLQYLSEFEFHLNSSNTPSILQYIKYFS